MAQEVLNRNQTVETHSRAFSNLASDAAVFDSSDTESLGHLTEIVSDAAAVRRASFWQIEGDGARLVCMDCYDNESKGHTRGTQFELNDFPQLFEYLQKKEAIVISDTIEETQFSKLHRVYLQPMGCRALLAVPVICRGQAQGALWFEHEGKARTWSLENISFAKAIAGLLALRLSAHQKPVPPLMVKGQGSESGDQMDRQNETQYQVAPAVEIESTVKDPEPIVRRPDSISDLINKRGHDGNGLEADVYPDVTVLVLRFIDPKSLARNVEADSSRSAIDSLVCHFEEMVAARELDYWNIVSDQIVCAAGLGEGANDHGRLIAETALNLQDYCTHLFADLDKRMAFRIGIDRGTVIGSQLGRRQQSYNIWGDAVGAALKMADSGVTGGIHVSEAAYRKLRASFVFKVRGYYYLKNIGEISTYLLTGRI
jgi:class 3 adenylate cyclase